MVKKKKKKQKQGGLWRWKLKDNKFSGIISFIIYFIASLFVCLKRLLFYLSRCRLCTCITLLRVTMVYFDRGAAKQCVFDDQVKIDTKRPYSQLN